MNYATPEGTLKYAVRFPELSNQGHFRNYMGLMVSSIGLGTYLGNADETDDRLYIEAVETALLSGINLIDTAVNYRCMRSERNIGKALRNLICAGKITREEVVVCTKGGFIPFDGKPPADPSLYIQENYLSTGIINPGELAAGCHCIAPDYIRNQLERSLQNLGLDCLDLYYLHNPETQLEEIPRDEFLFRLDHTFAGLELLVQAGKIRSFGAATWDGFRSPSAGNGHLALHDLLRTAERVVRGRHHFKAAQLPFNLNMTEAWDFPNQVLGSQTVPFLQAALANEISVFTSASILQSRLSHHLSPAVADTFPGLQTDAQRAIQFVRSTPGVTAALVGMKRKSHVLENLGTARVRPESPEKLDLLMPK